MSEGGPYHIDGKPVSRREYLTEYHGKVIADVAERGRYGYSDEGRGFLYLSADSIIPRPERVSIEGVFPIDFEALAKPSTQHRGRDSWTRFLQQSAQIQDNYTAATKRDFDEQPKHSYSEALTRLGRRYDELRGDYFLEDGNPRAVAVMALRAHKNEARESLQNWAKQIGPILESLRKVVAVLFLETWRAIDIEPETTWEDLPEERRNRLDSLKRLFVSRWRNAIFGASRTWAIGSDIGFWALGWGETPEELLQLQGPRILSLWDRRDTIIDEAFPVEVQRAACEALLGKIAQAEPVEPWSKKDEESRLPPRKKLDVQSHEALRDIIDLFDLLNADENLEREWESQTEIYRALAERQIKTKPKDLSEKAFIKTRSHAIRRAVHRTLEYLHKENILEKGSGSRSTPLKEKRVAKNICDWIFGLGRAHAPEWGPKDPFS